MALDSYNEARNFIADCLLREGYLTKSGLIDLKLFSRNALEANMDEITVRLYQLGFLPKDQEILEM